MRDRYRHWDAIAPRWRDNDIYGHVNNAVFYEYVDTVVNRFLIDGGLDIDGGTVVAVAASSSCEYLAPLTFPGAIDVGLAVTQLGRTSVHYEIGMFAGDEVAAVATFVHVFVDRRSRRPMPIPSELRQALATIAVDG